MDAKMKMLVAVAMGGALGALGRYFVVSQVGHWFGSGFPLGTLTVNIVGSFAMGLLIESMALVWSTSLEMRGFLAVGLLGAFTTFSTFSMEVVLLSQRGEMAQAAVYVVLSCGLCIGGLFAGLQLARAVLS